jgi:hypothetical protein
MSEVKDTVSKLRRTKQICNMETEEYGYMGNMAMMTNNDGYLFVKSSARVVSKKEDVAFIRSDGFIKIRCIEPLKIYVADLSSFDSTITTEMCPLVVDKDSGFWHYENSRIKEPYIKILVIE